MFILRDLLTTLQEKFSDTKQGQKRKNWFAYTLFAVVIPFTSSITSNLFRALQTLFGLEIQSQRFYTFMGSTTLLWRSLWRSVWGQIPKPVTAEQIIVALDDSINPKSGRKVFNIYQTTNTEVCEFCNFLLNLCLSKIWDDVKFRLIPLPKVHMNSYI